LFGNILKIYGSGNKVMKSNTKPEYRYRFVISNRSFSCSCSPSFLKSVKNSKIMESKKNPSIYKLTLSIWPDSYFSLNVKMARYIDIQEEARHSWIVISFQTVMNIPSWLMIINDVRLRLTSSSRSWSSSSESSYILYTFESILSFKLIFLWLGSLNSYFTFSSSSSLQTIDILKSYIVISCGVINPNFLCLSFTFSHSSALIPSTIFLDP